MNNPQLAFPALLIPADPFASVTLVDLGTDSYQGARQTIGCQLIEKVTVETGDLDSLDLLFDEEGGPTIRPDAEVNERATFLGFALKMAQLTGEFPAPSGVSKHDLAGGAEAWRRNVRLFGDVLVVAADERTGEWAPVGEQLVAFAAETLDCEEAL